MAAGFKQATVNASDVPATQTNFPAYVDLSRVGITTLAEAQSVRCYSDFAKTTELAREIVSATEMHVRIPTLTSTFVLYVDYDGVRADYAVTDTYGRNAVWSDYLHVFHMESAAGSVAVNSTGNDDGTTSGMADSGVTFPSTVDGKLVGNGYDFGTAAQKIGFSTTTKPSLWLDANRTTIQLWYKTNITFSGFTSVYINDQSVNNAPLYNNANQRIRSFMRAGSEVVSANNYSDNNWHQLHWVKDANTAAKLYINGGTEILSLSGTSTSAGTNRATFGVLDRNPAISLWGGQMDEVRIRNSDLSANWITTEYNNQSDEPGFWGTWTDAGGGPPAPTPRRLMMMGVGL